MAGVVKNYFKGSRENPYHLSVGAVILNDTDEVCCHYFKKLSLIKSFEGIEDFYLLMRETMEMGERVEETLHRGLMEEFGITAEIITYLGSIKSSYEVKVEEPQYAIEKTTLYFLVRMKSFKPELRSQADAERESEIQWQPVDFLVSKMMKQGRDYNGTLDESSVLEKTKKYLAAGN
jgi:8-oxo-dGTP pyrophosphatase MutT (NUDIX family)